MFKETYYPEKVEFEASVSLESNNLPDPYCYHFLNGKLFSPVTRTFVEDEITRKDAIEEAEYRAFKAIESWFTKNREGTAVWISPGSSAKDDYDASKIIFSEIIYSPPSGKRLRNRSVRFDWNEQDCLSFAEKIGFTKGNLRDTPIFLGPEVGVADILEPYASNIAQLIRDEQDFAFKEKLKSAIANGLSAPMGQFRLSCSRRGPAFALMCSDSLNLSEGYFDCPRCGRPIPSGRGTTTCPHCGAKKEDYGKSCD